MYVRPVQVFGTKGAYRCLLEEQRVRALLCCDGTLHAGTASRSLLW